MNLKAGYYKISKGEGSYQSFHYIHIFRKPDSKNWFVRIDHSIEQELTVENDSFLRDFQESYSLVKEYTLNNPTVISNAKITITFKDEDGDKREMSVNSLKRMNELFEGFPRIKKALE